MEAVEYVIQKGHRPQRTFFMAFGHDEEVRFHFFYIPNHCFLLETNFKNTLTQGSRFPQQCS